MAIDTSLSIQSEKLGGSKTDITRWEGEFALDHATMKPGLRFGGSKFRSLEECG